MQSREGNRKVCTTPAGLDEAQKMAVGRDPEDGGPGGLGIRSEQRSAHQEEAAAGGGACGGAGGGEAKGQAEGAGGEPAAVIGVEEEESCQGRRKE